MERKEKCLAFVCVMIVALAAMSVVTINGCASTPRAQYAQAQDVYIASVTVLLEARRQGQVDEPTWQGEILPLINLGNLALDQYSAATQLGANTLPAVETLQQVLLKLKPWIVKYTTRK